MIKHHTKNKGDIGVVAAKLDLLKKGYHVLNPETEHAPFDLGIWKDGVFKTVQVKYRKINKVGVLQINFESYWADRHGSHIVPVDKNLIDIYCVYCPETDKCYYFDPKEFGVTVSLRINPPKNNMKQGVHFAEDYLEVPFENKRL